MSTNQAFKPGDRVWHAGYLRDGTVTEVHIETIFIVQFDGLTDLESCKAEHLQRSLEPIQQENTMSHQFNQQHSDNGNTSHLDICKVPAGVRVTVTTRGGVTPSEVSTLSGWFDPAQAPGIALAILEAAGWPGEYPGGVSHQILADLRRVIEITDQQAKEAAQKEALEAEATMLYRAMREVDGHPWKLTFHELNSDEQREALALARAARKLHAVTA